MCSHVLAVQKGSTHLLALVLMFLSFTVPEKSAPMDVTVWLDEMKASTCDFVP